MDLGQGEDGEGEAGPALDILAGLASLGIAPALRDQVQQALADLSHVTADVDGFSAGLVGAAGKCVPGGTAGTAPASNTREGALQRKVEELEQKMVMSRSIMKKLYHKNVALEKDLAVAKVGPGGARHQQHRGSDMLAA